MAAKLEPHTFEVLHQLRGPQSEEAFIVDRNLDAVWIGLGSAAVVRIVDCYHVGCGVISNDRIAVVRIRKHHRAMLPESRPECRSQLLLQMLVGRMMAVSRKRNFLARVAGEQQIADRFDR
jgi:hypothetical protein